MIRGGDYGRERCGTASGRKNLTPHSRAPRAGADDQSGEDLLGTAGVGYQLLRMSDPHGVPSMLSGQTI